jgi:hypothetical protein
MTRAQYSQRGATLPSVDREDPAGIALAMSKRLIAVFKNKRILNIEVGLEMMALAMVICSMVCNFGMYLNHIDLFRLHKNGGRFPEIPGEVNNLLKRFGFRSCFG